MEFVTTTPHNMSEFWEVAGKYVVLWVILYDDEQADYDALLDAVKSLNVPDLPTGILLLNVTTEDWVEDSIYHQRRPVLLPFMGGLPVVEILTDHDINTRLTKVVEPARRLLPLWLKNRK